MNSRNLVPALIIGAVVGLAIGLITYKANNAGGDFFSWIYWRPEDALPWLVAGMIVAGAATFLKFK